MTYLVYANLFLLTQIITMESKKITAELIFWQEWTGPDIEQTSSIKNWTFMTIYYQDSQITLAYIFNRLQ